MLQFSKEHRAEGAALQQDFSAFDVELREAIDEVWKKTENEEQQPADSWAARMQDKEKERLVDPIERVQKPDMGVVQWELYLLQLKG